MIDVTRRNNIFDDTRISRDDAEAIDQLRDECGAAGDSAGVEICERALEGDECAIREALAMIADARAMED